MNKDYFFANGKFYTKVSTAIKNRNNMPIYAFASDAFSTETLKVEFDNLTRHYTTEQAIDLLSYGLYEKLENI